MRLSRVSRWMGGAVVGLAATVAFASPASASGYKMSHSEAASSLRSVGITWSRPAAAATATIRPARRSTQINQARSTGSRRCGAPAAARINITGGTETGHAVRHLQPLERLQARHQQVHLHRQLHHATIHLHRLPRATATSTGPRPATSTPTRATTGTSSTTAAARAWSDDAGAHRAVRHLPGRHAVPGGRRRRPCGCWSGSATRWSSRPGRPAAGRCTSTPATSATALPLVRRHVEVFDAVRRGRRAVRVVRRARCGTSTPMVARPAGDEALAARAEAVAARTYELSELLVDVLGVDRRRRVLPAPGDLPPDLPLAADAAGRRQAAAAAARGARARPGRAARRPSSAAASAARSR